MFFRLKISINIPFSGLKLPLFRHFEAKISSNKPFAPRYGLLIPPHPPFYKANIRRGHSKKIFFPIFQTLLTIGLRLLFAYVLHIHPLIIFNYCILCFIIAYLFKINAYLCTCKLNHNGKKPRIRVIR